MSYYPFIEESVDNATAVEFEVGDRGPSEFLVSIEITTGAATGGTVAIAVVPFGASEYQTLATSIDCKTPVPGTISGKFSKVKFTPSTLDAGAKFTAILDSMDR